MLSKLRSQISEGLRSKTLTTCTKWTKANVVMGGADFPGPFSDKYHPWMTEMQDTEARFNVGQKAAQMGYSTACLHWSMFKIAVMKQSVLYLLPNKNPDASDFSVNRFDPMLEISPNLQKVFNDVKNVGSKRAGSSILYVRGANSRTGLKSIPTGNIVEDESDEMEDWALELAEERQSGQSEKQTWMISTPRFPGKGINERFLKSTQEHFMFKCPGCSRRIELLHDNLVVTATDPYDIKALHNSYYKCLDCEKQLTDPSDDKFQYRERKAAMLGTALWTPFNQIEQNIRGFYINQMYSSTVFPHELARKWLQTFSSLAAEQEYWNSKQGTAHESEGARITDTDINEATYFGITPQVNSYIVTMGVDVGKFLHYEIAAWNIVREGSDINASAEPVILESGRLNMTAGCMELDEKMRQYQVLMCVIDANPEFSSAIAFAKRFKGHVRLCYYPRSASPSEKLTLDNANHKVNVHRTTWLDTALGRFKNRTIKIPGPVGIEYRSHLKNIARIYEEDADGNQVGRYISNGADHLAHARNYNEIALPLAVSFKTNKDVAAFL